MCVGMSVSVCGIVSVSVCVIVSVSVCVIVSVSVCGIVSVNESDIESALLRLGCSPLPSRHGESAKQGWETDQIPGVSCLSMFPGPHWRRP